MVWMVPSVISMWQEPETTSPECFDEAEGLTEVVTDV